MVRADAVRDVWKYLYKGQEYIVLGKAVQDHSRKRFRIDIYRILRMRDNLLEVVSVTRFDSEAIHKECGRAKGYCTCWKGSVQNAAD